MNRQALGVAVGWLFIAFPCLAETDEGAADFKPWSGSYWPMREAQLIRGPLTKYDAITGRNAVAEETRINPPDADLPLWMGYCHAWAAASLLEAEPRHPTRAFDRSGKAVPLSVGDQKGMLTACHTEDEAHHYGIRFDGEPDDDPQDIYPDVLWQVLQTYVASQGVPIIIDTDPGTDVWNYPVFRYRVDYQPADERGRYRAKMWLWAADDNVPLDYVGTKEAGLKYTFEFRMLRGAVVAGSGRWTGESRTDHPDFAWYPFRQVSENSQIDRATVHRILGRRARASSDSGRRPTRLTATRPERRVSGGSQPHTSGDRWPLAAPIEPAPSMRSDFHVSLAVDRASRTYIEGETIHAHVRSAESGYLYLFYQDARGRVACLFPNQMQPDHYVQAGQHVRIPHPAARFRLRVGAPFGDEQLVAIVAPRPLEALARSGLSQADMTPIDNERYKAVFVEAKDPGVHPHPDRLGPTRRQAPFRASFSRLRLKTRKNQGGVASVSPGRRLGVFVGIGEYRNPGIRPLVTPRHDAAEFSKSLRIAHALDEVVTLLDGEATLERLRRVFCEELLQATRPGDTVLLYWSGHGGRWPTSRDDEADGFSEYLIPHDGRRSSRGVDTNTMLTDRMLGRWLDGLRDRQFIVILDACHSGGQADEFVKSMSREAHAGSFGEGFARRLQPRVKNITASQTAVLASSTAAQVSYERRAGDLSVMTHFLIDKVESSLGPLSMRDAASYVRRLVPQFVGQEFPGSTQTPVFVSRAARPLYLKP